MGTSDNLHDDPEKENEKLSDEKRERDERKKRRIEEKKQKKKAAEDKDRFIRETLKIDHKNNLRVYSRRVGVTLLLALFFGMVAGVTFFVANHFISIPYLDDNGKGMETPTVSTSETPAAERSQTETVSNAIMPEDLTTLQGYEDVSKKLAGIGNSFNDSITSFTVNSADDTGVNYPDSLVPGLIFDEDDEHYYIVASGADGKYSKSSMQVGDDFSVAVDMLGEDKNIGLAVFSAEKSDFPEEKAQSLKKALLSDSAGLIRGNLVIAVGCPDGCLDTVVTGIVTNTMDFQSTDNEIKIIKTDIPYYPQASGFVSDINGRIVGIITTDERTGKGNMSFISIDSLRSEILGLEAGNGRLYFGIKGTGVDKEKAEEDNLTPGIYIDQVDPESPAFESGLRNADTITKINGNDISSMNEFNSLIYNIGKGEKFDIAIVRNNEEKILTGKVSEK
jgi:serine protease Do